jgi:hypothetical protein
MLSDPDWYKQQGQQARALANQASVYFSYLTSGEGRAVPPAVSLSSPLPPFSILPMLKSLQWAAHGATNEGRAATDYCGAMPLTR